MESKDSVIGQYVKKILSSRVYDIAVQTPLQQAVRLSHRLHNQVYLKREDLQSVFSFKIRGAYNKVAHLTEEQRAQGVITASAGNHAQGLAAASLYLGLQATIVMPETTPKIKVDSVKSRKAKVILVGDSFDQAYQYSKELVKQQGAIYVHPYDDEWTIAGQGTIGMEILRQHPAPIAAIFLPVGGGGLISGVSAYVKYLRPETKVIGVEAEDSACLKAALSAKKRVKLPEIGLFPDGIAVAQIGEKNYEVARYCVDEVITVSIDEICTAIKYVFEDTRVVAEPAGAAAIAGMKKYVELQGLVQQNVVAVLSGANINFDRIKHVVERSETGEYSEALLAVKVVEKPGSFLALSQLLAGYNVTEFNYRFQNAKDVKSIPSAEIFLGVTLANHEGTLDREDALPKLLGLLRTKGYDVCDLSDNEMAKIHVRYMVGGRAEGVADERLYRFQFPEKPGALLRFLQALHEDVNITLFHYRNNGAAYGRVLVGLQALSGDWSLVQARFDQLGYPYWEESANPAYQKFLK